MRAKVGFSLKTNVSMVIKFGFILSYLSQIQPQVNTIAVHLPHEAGNVVFAASKVCVWCTDQTNEKVQRFRLSITPTAYHTKTSCLQYDTKREAQMKRMSNNIYWLNFLFNRLKKNNRSLESPSKRRRRGCWSRTAAVLNPQWGPSVTACSSEYSCQEKYEKNYQEEQVVSPFMFMFWMQETIFPQVNHDSTNWRSTVVPPEILQVEPLHIRPHFAALSIKDWFGVMLVVTEWCGTSTIIKL